MTAIQPRPLISQPMPQADAHAPIGIFDSGIGGLSVVKEIAQYLPNERIIYFADTAHVPYGSRSGQDIQELTAHPAHLLFQQAGGGVQTLGFQAVGADELREALALVGRGEVSGLLLVELHLHAFARQPEGRFAARQTGT